MKSAKRIYFIPEGDGLKVVGIQPLPIAPPGCSCYSDVSWTSGEPDPYGLSCLGELEKSALAEYLRRAGGEGVKHDEP